MHTQWEHTHRGGTQDVSARSVIDRRRQEAAKKPRKRGAPGGDTPDLMAELQEIQIRQRLREAREQAGLSRERLADLLTVHVNSIRNYETKRTPWTLMNAWGQATGKSLEWLLHGQESSQPGDAQQLDRIEILLTEIRDQLAVAVGGARAYDPSDAAGSPTPLLPSTAPFDRAAAKAKRSRTTKRRGA